MYTVFIKAVDPDLLIDVDEIGRIGFSGNEIFAFSRLEEQYSIYRGKAVNSEKALVETVALIHSAKKFSEKTESALIMDFSKDFDNPTIVRPNNRDVTRFSRISV